MNNTKWREVLAEIASSHVVFSIAYVGKEKFGIQQTLSNPTLNEHYVGDGCIIGGPVEYKDIFAVRVERFEELKNPKTGRSISDESQSLALVERLKNYGLLPIEIDENYITIRGYQP